MIGVLIPDRNDRPLFLEHCLYMLSQQTLQPHHIEIVNDEPLSSAIDITYRYRIGCERLFAKACDRVLFIENDDWYRNDYIDLMNDLWKVNMKPDIFGLGKTTYYHIGTNKYTTMVHSRRASAFATMVTPAIMYHDFGKDSEPFFDIHLWKMPLKKITFFHTGNICLGIKHGKGSCGGKAHSKAFPYDNNDSDLSYLKSIVDEVSFKFYTSIK